MIIVIVVSFACLSVGFLLCGIACVKEAFTPKVTHEAVTRRIFRDALNSGRS